MADNSNIVLRWGIDNATAKFATGKVESEVFNEGGFKWIASLNRKTGGALDGDFTLQCEKEHYKLWKCEVRMDMTLLQANGGVFAYKARDPFCFDENNSRWLQKDRTDWSTTSGPGYLINDKLSFELRINIINSEIGQSLAAMFDAPNRKSNVILKIGEKKLHVSKELLAIHSPVFDTMFFGNFSENGKEEVEIKEVVYEEFLALLNFYLHWYIEDHGYYSYIDRTVVSLMKLADLYQMDRVLGESELYLIESKVFDVMKKLFFADQYRLVALRDHCLQSFTSVADLAAKLKSSPDYDNFSYETKAAICDRIKNL